MDKHYDPRSNGYDKVNGVVGGRPMDADISIRLATAGVNQPPKEVTPYEGLTDELAQAQQATRAMLDRLAKRLQPVLCAENPSPSEVGCSPVHEVPILRDLQRAIDVQRDLNETIHVLTARVGI